MTFDDTLRALADSFEGRQVGVQVAVDGSGHIATLAGEVRSVELTAEVDWEGAARAIHLQLSTGVIVLREDGFESAEHRVAGAIPLATEHGMEEVTVGAVLEIHVEPGIRFTVLERPRSLTPDS